MNLKHLAQALAPAVFFLLLASCGKGKEKAAETEAPTPVQVEEARRGPIDHIISADAVLYPIDQASVTSRIGAPLRRVLVNRGDHVKAGQLVAELESRDLAAAASEGKSQLDQAQANYLASTGATMLDEKTKSQADLAYAQQSLEAAKKVYENRVELVKQGALAQKLADDARVAMVQAQSQFDTVQRHLQTLNSTGQREQTRSAQAQVDAAKAHLESLNAQLSYAQIRSPIAGVVADRPVYPGEMAASGTPIVAIVDISQIVARANVPVKEALSIKVGSPATIPGPDGDIAGKVIVVSPAVNPSTTTVEVWVQAPNPGEKLKPGGTVHVAIRAETLKDVILVPAAALLNFEEGGLKVMVVGSDNLAQERRITTGVRQGDNVQIATGLREGEKVVVSGGLGLEDKAKVKIVEAPPADADEDEK
ncbi:MAG: efflux RND transporter periplasmic adaptor subunit [Acidobacteriota bacterium]